MISRSFKLPLLSQSLPSNIKCFTMRKDSDRNELCIKLTFSEVSYELRSLSCKNVKKRKGHLNSNDQQTASVGVSRATSTGRENVGAEQLEKYFSDTKRKFASFSFSSEKSLSRLILPFSGIKMAKVSSLVILLCFMRMEIIYCSIPAYSFHFFETKSRFSPLKQNIF